MVARGARLSAVMLGLMLVGGCRSATRSVSAEDAAKADDARRAWAQAVTSYWSGVSMLAARRLMDQYGAPDSVRADSITWNRCGPWKRTVVRDVSPQDPGIIEQAVDYRLNPLQASALNAFDKSLIYDAPGGELRARSDSESLNYLRLNLADDVVKGRMSVMEASTSFDRIVALLESGKTSDYVLRLRFDPAHPDK